MSPRPPCPGCGDPHPTGIEALCSVCWSSTSKPTRARIHAAQRQLARRPTSPAAVSALGEAIAAAAGALP